MCGLCLARNCEQIQPMTRTSVFLTYTLWEPFVTILTAAAENAFHRELLFAGSLSWSEVQICKFSTQEEVRSFADTTKICASRSWHLHCVQTQRHVLQLRAHTLQCGRGIPAAERVMHSPISANGHTANRLESVRARTAVFPAYQASTVAHIPMMQPMFRLTFRVKVTHLPK